jgi:hypothetical protein
MTTQFRASLVEAVPCQLARRSRLRVVFAHPGTGGRVAFQPGDKGFDEIRTTAGTGVRVGNRMARELFARLPPRDDGLARLLSPGQDRRWRRCVVDRIATRARGLCWTWRPGRPRLTQAVARRTGATVVGAQLSNLGSSMTCHPPTSLSRRPACCARTNRPMPGEQVRHAPSSVGSRPERGALGRAISRRPRRRTAGGRAASRPARLRRRAGTPTPRHGARDGGAPTPRVSGSAPQG